MPVVLQRINENDIKSHIQFTDILRNTTGTSSKTTTDYPEPTTTPESGLSNVAIGFIVFGIIVLLIGLGVLIFCICRRKKRKRSTPTVAFAVAAPPPSSSAPLVPCVKPLCKEYLYQLNLNKAYFANRYDKCWCSSCHDPTNSRGTCEKYCKQQHGWIRFGLSVNAAHQKQWRVFREWKTSYYGTSAGRLAPILTSRFFLIDGDQLPNRTRFDSGHADTNRFTTSPSLICASQPKFATPSYFRARDGTQYDVLVVLEYKQKPGTFTVHGNHDSFHTIEWKSDTRSASIPVGLFMKLKRRSA